MLAPFEVLFDELDEELSALAPNIHPDTAPERWTGALLRWLGFPALDDLDSEARRALLGHAPQLLARRGTAWALEQMLEIVTGGSANVDDPDGAMGWVLPGPHLDPGDAGARLGRDTVAPGQQPGPFRAGGAMINTTPLGLGCTDPVLTLATQARAITVDIDIAVGEEERLRPIVERLLAFFVPAHCRTRVVYSTIDSRRRSRQLDHDLRLDDDGDGRLHGDSHWQLRANTRLAAWRLPRSPDRSFRLDHDHLSDLSLT